MPTEYILAYHCAPAFAGIKPSNIASCSKRENPNITVQIKMLNEKLNKNDIYIDVLCAKCRGNRLEQDIRET